MTETSGTGIEYFLPCIVGKPRDWYLVGLEFHSCCVLFWVIVEVLCCLLVGNARCCGLSLPGVLAMRPAAAVTTTGYVPCGILIHQWVIFSRFQLRCWSIGFLSIDIERWKLAEDLVNSLEKWLFANDGARIWKCVHAILGWWGCESPSSSTQLLLGQVSRCLRYQFRQKCRANALPTTALAAMVKPVFNDVQLLPLSPLNCSPLPQQEPGEKDSAIHSQNKYHYPHRQFSTHFVLIGSW